MLKILSIGAALSLFLVSSALAESKFGTCAADIKKACADVKPGEGRIGACIKGHLNDFSEPCKTKLSKIAAAAKACGDDVKKKCGDVRGGNVRKAVCLKDALMDLGDECKTAVSAAVAGKD